MRRYTSCSVRVCVPPATDSNKEMLLTPQVAFLKILIDYFENFCEKSHTQMFVYYKSFPAFTILQKNVRWLPYNIINFFKSHRQVIKVLHTYVVHKVVSFIVFY